MSLRGGGLGFARTKTVLSVNKLKRRNTWRRKLDVEDGNGEEKRKTA